jgi:hypothetical protein
MRGLIKALMELVAFEENPKMKVWEDPDREKTAVHIGPNEASPLATASFDYNTARFYFSRGDETQVTSSPSDWISLIERVIPTLAAASV